MGIDPTLRPEQLSVEQFIGIARWLHQQEQQQL